jgi:hypothetical protein
MTAGWKRLTGMVKRLLAHRGVAAAAARSAEAEAQLQAWEGEGGKTKPAVLPR